MEMAKPGERERERKELSEMKMYTNMEIWINLVPKDLPPLSIYSVPSDALPHMFQIFYNTQINRFIDR